MRDVYSADEFKGIGNFFELLWQVVDDFFAGLVELSGRVPVEGSHGAILKTRRFLGGRFKVGSRNGPER